MYVPVFRFALTKHTVQEWIRLYASAIRCSLQPCGYGFVFIKWKYTSGGESHAHLTAMGLDLDKKQQVFIDPSKATAHTGQRNLQYYFS